jgi:tocopherol O-methyltransferase
MQYNDTSKIREHYDIASPLYKELWGQHIHHGYWIRGDESKEEAVQNLVDLLIAKSGLERGSKVLDVGCGVGGTSIFLAKEWACDVTGITISPVQVDMATKAAQGLSNAPRFLVQDANNITVKGPFDIIWSVEMISHLNNRDNLFRRASELLKPGGRMCITDWWKAEGLSDAEERRYIKPIEKPMLVSLPTHSEYAGYIDKYGFDVLYYEDISRRVARTWDITSESIKPKAIWNFATKHGLAFVDFLHSFKAMRAGFKSGAFRYPAMVLEKKHKL